MTEVNLQLNINMRYDTDFTTSDKITKKLEETVDSLGTCEDVGIVDKYPEELK